METDRKQVERNITGPKRDRIAYSLGFVFGLVLMLLSPNPTWGQKPHTHSGRRIYWSPDHRLRATIFYRKPRFYGGAESRVEIRTAQKHLLAQADYSSQSGAHGFSVVKAAWTPNSRFFVYSTESSGGHSPWHYPTYVYSRQRSHIYSLEDQSGPTTKGDFLVRKPDKIQTTCLGSKKLLTIDLHRWERKLPSGDPK